jgi:hypothetical protein
MHLQTWEDYLFAATVVVFAIALVLNWIVIAKHGVFTYETLRWQVWIVGIPMALLVVAIYVPQ